MPIKIRGKEYRTVAERMVMFHEKRDEGDSVSVETEIEELNDTFILMKSTVTHHKKDQEQPDVFVGHALEFIEKTNKQNVNFASYTENCETSAIGRALAAAGLSGSEYASAEEMSRIESKTKAREVQEDKRETLLEMLRVKMKEKSVPNDKVQAHAMEMHRNTVRSLEIEELNEMVDWIEKEGEGDA